MIKRDAAHLFENCDIEKLIGNWKLATGNSILIAIKMVIVGHQKQFELLERARQSGRMGHAYILSGPEKIGKKTIALEWLSRIYGVRLAAGIAHPDFLFVGPLIDPKTDKAAEEITVGQVRELIRRLSLKPVIGKVKAAVIDEAHLMNSEAQNCLLKTLEEPPGDALIILITRNSQRLLETIRSRCEVMRFNFVSEKEIKSALSIQFPEAGHWRNSPKPSLGKAGPEGLEEIVKLSFGRPGRMMEFIADQNRINKWREQEKEFAGITAAELPEKFAYAKKITDSENPEINLNEIIEVWQFYFRNLMLEKLNQDKNTADIATVRPSQDVLRRSDRRIDATQFVFSKTKQGAYTLEKIAAILKKIHDLSVTLQTTNTNPKLAIENFMLDI